MKPDIHPEYREVVFLDTQNGTSFITRSTISTSETTTVDGVEFPLAKVEISAASHPFYTGTMTIVDTAGRVERFEKRYGRRKQRAGEAAAEEASAAEAPAAEEAQVTEAPAAEAPAAEEAQVAEAPGEAPAAEEVQVAEAPGEAPAAEEVQVAEAPGEAAASNDEEE